MEYLEQHFRRRRTSHISREDLEHLFGKNVLGGHNMGFCPRLFSLLDFLLSGFHLSLSFSR